MTGELERFRERLRGKGKDKDNDTRKFGITDWLPIGISIIALAWTVGSSYFHDFRVVDDVRLAVDLDWPRLDVTDASRASIYAGQFLTFTNAGNRAMAVTAANLILGLAEEHLQGQCATSQGLLPSVLGVVMDSFVIKPGEILVKDYRLNRKQPFARDDHGTVVVDLTTRHDQAPIKFNACLQLNMLTPDNDQRLVEVPLVTFQYDPGFRGAAPSRAISFPRDPIQLWKPKAY